MEIDQILQHPPLSLTDEQRRFYFDNGYLLVESAVPENWLNRLRDATNEMIERSREFTISDSIWDLERNHSPDEPRLRRLTSPNDHHDVYWKYASSSLITDIVADLVGPDVKVSSLETEF